MNKAGYAALRRNRYSISNAEYFLTLNTHLREVGLCVPPLLEKISAVKEALEVQSLWQVRCSVVMLDHLHLLIRLIGDKSLQETMRLFKGRLSPALRAAGLKWQDGFYEHRMRDNEDRTPVFIYIFLNPYRAELIARTQSWPGYFCSDKDWNWFSKLTDNELPMPEWLQ